jgi:hypothetical protein
MIGTFSFNKLTCACKKPVVISRDSRKKDLLFIIKKLIPFQKMKTG